MPVELPQDKKLLRHRIINFLALFGGMLLLMLISGCVSRNADTEPAVVQIDTIRAQPRDADQHVMTEIELQAQVMRFADRFASHVMQGYEAYEKSKPSVEQRRTILRNAVFSVSAAYTIAADADPDAAFLDMLVMVSLGEQIYAEHWVPRIGDSILPLAEGMRVAKEDIWNIAGGFLRTDQLQELQDMLREWRQDNPEKLTFSYVRFSDFSAYRGTSSLTRTGDPGGIFRSVEMATRQVEEIRLIAERKAYLATRLPLLTGFYLDMTVSQAFANPQVAQTLTDLNNFAETSEQLVGMMEELPEQVAIARNALIQQAFERFAAERRETITQLMDRVAVERKKTIEEFLDEEERLKGILRELKETLSAGNNLVVGTSSLVEQLNLGQGDSDSPPFDIAEYKKALQETTATIAQLNLLVGESNRLINSSGWENFLPKLEKTIDRVGSEGNEIIDHTFLRGFLLLLTWLVFYLLAKLIIHRVTRQSPAREEKS